MPSIIEDPLSFLLNLLPTKFSRLSRTATPWILHWPTICSILFELDHLCHPIDTCTRPPHRQILLNWLSKHSGSYYVPNTVPLIFFILEPEGVFFRPTLLCIELVRANRCDKHPALKWIL